MGLLSDLTPLNLLEEKDKFFSSSTYNPQFKYNRNFSKTVLTKYGIPRPEMFKLATDMVLHFGIPKSRDIERAISKESAKIMTEHLLKKYNLSDQINVNFSENLSGGCLLKPGAISFRLPLRYSEKRFRNLLRHEVETHLLRKFNDKLQPWHDGKRHSKVRRTEEGLATLHSYLDHGTKKLRSSFINYAAVGFSQTMSFRQVYMHLLGLGADKIKAWKLTVNVKRGLTDTSVVGGFTKTIVYLEGVVEISRWILTADNDPRDLYCGLIAWEQISVVKSQANYVGLRLPEFLDDIKAYKAMIRAIVDVNQLEKIW